MQVLWVDGNLTFKPDDEYDLGLLDRIDDAIAAWKDREPKMKITGTWTNVPEDAFRIAL